MRRFHIADLMIAIVVCFVVASAVCAGTVTVDWTSRTGKSDVAALEVKGVKAQGRQLGFVVQSNSLEPQSATLSVTGLASQEYDIYINGSYVGEKDAASLLSGFMLEIPGTVTDADSMLCLNALKAKVVVAEKLYQGMKGSEPQRVLNTMRQARDWVDSGIRSEKAYRSADVIIAPAGRVLQKMAFRTRNDAKATAFSTTNACYLLQQARDRMFRVLKDRDLSNDAVVAMTPVELSATYSVANGKGHVRATLVNNCNLPIAGKLTLAVPKGWKTNAKKLDFDGLKCGKTFTLSCDVIPAVKGDEAPQSVAVAANVRIAQDAYVAELKLKSVAKKPAPEPKPAVPPTSE